MADLKTLAKALSSALAGGDWKGAHETAMQVAGISPGLGALSDYFVKALAQRKLREAMRVIQECAHLTPEQPPEFWDLAGCFFLDMDNMASEAVSSFLKAMPAMQKSPATCTNLALAYLADRKVVDAVSTLQMASKAVPGSPRVSNLLKFLSEGEAAADHKQPFRFSTPVTLFPYPLPELFPKYLQVEGTVNAMAAPMKMEVRLKDPASAGGSPFVEWRKLFVSCWADGGLHLQFGTVMKVLGPSLVVVSMRKAFKKFQRRQFKRIPVQSGVSGTVSCERLAIQAKLDLVELSAGGCQFYFPISPAKEERVDVSFSFQFPDIAARFEQEAIVRMIKPLGNQFVVAVEFQIDEATQERLDEVLTKCEFRLRKF